MIKKIILISVAVLALVIANPAQVEAQGFLQNLFGGGSSGGTGGGCGDTKTHLVGCEGETGVEAIGQMIQIALIVMTTLIGAISMGALAYAGILYASARDDKQKVSQAIKVVRNVVVGILMYVLTIALIAWLIPSNVINAPEPTEQSEQIDPETGQPIDNSSGDVVE